MVGGKGSISLLHIIKDLTLNKDAIIKDQKMPYGWGEGIIAFQDCVEVVSTITSG